MALGADRPNIIRLVLRAALLQVAVGLAIGVPAALASGKLLASQLYGVQSHDPWILAAATVLLTACALAAGFVPARRAASVDPIRSLRVE
jgi:ABC-type antimicrobial peptide transport system permease subunit